MKGVTLGNGGIQLGTEIILELVENALTVYKQVIILFRREQIACVHENQFP